MPDRLNAFISIAHAGATCFMTGLIWFVQIVHYPLMGEVPAEALPGYAKAHQRRTTWIVAPVMLLEAISAILFLWLPQAVSFHKPFPRIGLALLVFIWASTFAVQVPLLAKLALGLDRNAWRQLVASNWLRTFAWSTRGLNALFLLR